MAELGSLRLLGQKGPAHCLILSIKFYWNTARPVYVLLSGLPQSWTPLTHPPALASVSMMHLLLWPCHRTFSGSPTLITPCFTLLLYLGKTSPITHITRHCNHPFKNREPRHGTCLCVFVAAALAQSQTQGDEETCPVCWLAKSGARFTRA